MAKRRIKLAPLSDDARVIATSLNYAAADIRAFVTDERMAKHTLSRDFCTEQAAYYEAMATDWMKLAKRMEEIGC